MRPAAHRAQHQLDPGGGAGGDAGAGAGRWPCAGVLHRAAHAQGALQRCAIMLVYFGCQNRSELVSAPPGGASWPRRSWARLIPRRHSGSSPSPQSPIEAEAVLPSVSPRGVIEPTSFSQNSTDEATAAAGPAGAGGEEEEEEQASPRSANRSTLRSSYSEYYDAAEMLEEVDSASAAQQQQQQQQQQGWQQQQQQGQQQAAAQGGAALQRLRLRQLDIPGAADGVEQWGGLLYATQRNGAASSRGAAS